MFVKIDKMIREQSLIREGDTVIVGLSGGADSIALLDVLLSLQEQRLRVVAAHLNHLLRDAESDEDEAFVQEFCTRRKVVLEIRRFDVEGFRVQKKLSLEEAGRVARYEFLHEMALKHEAAVIAIAHHADDQAETVLMRLIRGSAATGLTAMAPKTGKIVRPLLEVTRQEIEQYLEQRGLSYRIDSSNADTDFFRNRVRHELVPVLATYNHAIVKRLNATAKALAADEAVLEQVCEVAYQRHRIPDAEFICLSIAGVRAEQPGIRFRLYRRAVLQLKDDLARIGSVHLNAIDQIVFSAKPNQALNLPEGVRISKSYDTLYFFAAAALAEAVLAEASIPGIGQHRIAGVGTLVVTEGQFPVVREANTSTVAFFDANATPFPWVVRGFRAGDRITPLGMSGSKKIKDIFIDGKVPRQSRWQFPLLFSAERLVWMIPLRVSEATRVTPESQQVLRVELIGFSPRIDL